MSIRTVLLGCFFACLALTFSDRAHAQTVSAGSMLYIELPQLTTDNYDELFAALKAHPTLELKESCIPAHVVAVRVKSGSGTAQQFFDSFRASAGQAGLSQSTLLTGYTDESFMNRCRSARFGQ